LSPDLVATQVVRSRRFLILAETQRASLSQFKRLNPLTPWKRVLYESPLYSHLESAENA
jgi:hypothetical protein